ncbi:hypothetical protein C474_08607 [Halogeometricum pallidum JCM 14848]|uniref:DUF1616 domain-containing protein n=1 Tax=Halogeometricum pallidum JCM 14848 TaxID=1227487 RepID=M0DAZ3_HALPD|nr:DUF1616 domain-containing protein [Halogeometricum pallidum]ELZ31349.1 hypothetical protein C474_08607 [Halogeometricum pallidum JCM 14848]
MTSTEDWRVLLPRPLRVLPADLVAILTLTLLTIVAVSLPILRETPLRVVVGLPFLLFVPGYAIISALFPERARTVADPQAQAGEREATETVAGIDGIERVALSFGTSIAVVPLVGFALNFTPFGIRLAPIMASLTIIVVFACTIAASRRWDLPEDERFRVPYRSWYANTKAELFSPATRTDAALNVVLVVSLLLAFSAVGYAVAVPSQGEQFSELYLLTENESGEYVADDYPTNFTAGEPQSLIVGIGNQENEPVEYTVVSEIQRVEVSNNSTTVLEREQLQTFSPRLQHNETWQQPHQVSPTMTGENLRLIYYLYKGDAPATPSEESAYREVHLWVNVTEK